MAAEIYLLRHGETDWNAQGRFQGKLELPSDLARSQAEDVGRLLSAVLKGRNVALHVSPLGRGRETAELFAISLMPLR
jgi:broad specificity phosphatase PhoE